MSRQVQLRRGTAVQHQTFTGLVGELTMNTTNNSLRLHDNVLNGGHEMLKADMSNVLISSDGTFSLLDSLGNVSVRITNVADPVDNQDVATKAWVLANIGNNVGNFTFNNGDITNIVDNYINLQASNYAQLESNGSYVWVEYLSDVDIAGITNGQTLIWDNGNSKFIASDFPATYTDTDAINAVGQNLVDNNLNHTDITFTLDNDNITASVSVALNDIAGVTITNPVEIYEVLKYNGGGAFINAQLSLSDLSDGNNTTPKLEVVVKTTNYTSESNKIYLNDDVDNLIVTLHNIADIGDVFFVQVNHDFSSTTVNTTFASVLYKGQIYSNPNNLVLSNNTTGLYQFRYMNDGIDSYATDFSNALSTLDIALGNLSNDVNPANFFQIANLFNEILGNVSSQNTAKVNLGLVDDQGRFIESIDYGAVTDNVIGSSMDFQDANGTGETPLNAEDLFITTVYYSLEDYGCLIG